MFRSEHSPSDFYSFGAHGGRLPPSSWDLGCALFRRLADPPSRSTSLVTTSGPAFKNAGPGRFSSKRKEIRAGPSARYPVSGNSPTFGLGVALLQESKAQEIAARACSLVLSSSGLRSQVSGLGLRSYPSGSFVPEAITTLFSFTRPDRSVYATASVTPLGPCPLTSAMAGPPYPSVSGEIYDFYGRLHSGLGRPHGGFPNFWYMGPSGPLASYQLLGTQAVEAASGPPGDDRYEQFNSSFLYQQARRDSVPHLVTSGSEAFYVVTSSEYSCPSKTHPRLSERDSRPPISSQPADIDRVEPPSRNVNRIFGVGYPSLYSGWLQLDVLMNAKDVKVHANDNGATVLLTY